MTFCTPAPAAELTHERCAVHATFAYGLVSDNVTSGQLTAFVQEHTDEVEYFVAINDHVVETRKATGRPVSDDAIDYAQWLLGQCNAAIKAVMEGTV